MSGIVAKAYIGIANGSPCVVPSWDRREDPSTKRSVESLQVFMRVVAIEGQNILMFWRATWRLRELKALLASTNRTASVLSLANAPLRYGQRLQLQLSGWHRAGGIWRRPEYLLGL